MPESVLMGQPGAVSLTFRELPKIFSRKYTTPEITFMVIISIWKFVRVPKARLSAHLQCFSLKFSSQVLFVQYTNFEIIFWRARETLVKQPPAAPQQGMLGALIVWWPASFWLHWAVAEGTVHTGSPAKFPTKPTDEWKQNRKMYAIKQIKICAEYRDMLPRPRLVCQEPGLRPIY